MTLPGVQHMIHDSSLECTCYVYIQHLVQVLPSSSESLLTGHPDLLCQEEWPQSHLQSRQRRL